MFLSSRFFTSASPVTRRLDPREEFLAHDRLEVTGSLELPAGYTHPEERSTKRPTAEQIFRLFALTQRHVLRENGKDGHVFLPELTDLQMTVLMLLGVPKKAYLSSS